MLVLKSAFLKSSTDGVEDGLVNIDNNLPAINPRTELGLLQIGINGK